MAADFTKPLVGGLYTAILAEIRDNANALAVGLDPAVVTPASVPTNAVRWNSALNKDQKFNGTTWEDKSANYAINISGNAVSATTAAACSGNAATATTAAACSGNSATATTAAACSGNAATATTAAACSGNSATATLASGLNATALAVANTWTAGMTLSAAGGGLLVINSTNSTIDKVILKDAGAQTGRLSSSASYPLLVGNAAGTNWSFYGDQAGNFTAIANVTAYSDERLKNNWANLPADFIERLAKVKYGTYDRNDIEQRQIGVSAQSLRPVMPEAVMTDFDGMLMVAYGNAALTACIALSEEVVRLRARLDTLERK